jgi:heat shock transcription factor
MADMAGESEGVASPKEESDLPGNPPTTGSNISPFLWKTYNLVSDASTDHILSWTNSGRAFTVWRPDLMERELLPRTFKHANFASFVRQLNNYGFHKIHSDRYEFAADGFMKDRPDLLHVRPTALTQYTHGYMCAATRGRAFRSG